MDTPDVCFTLGPIVGGNPSHSALQQQQAQREAAQRAMEAAKTRAKQPTDKNIPEGVEDLIVGDGVKQYRDLREMERRLDAVMMRKRLDLHEIRPQTHDRTRTLRIWISNTAENQPWQGRGLDENAFDFNTGMEGTYKVKIEGRVLDDENAKVDSDEEDEDEADNEAVADGQAEKSEDVMDHDGTEESPKKVTNPIKPRQKMSHFFKSIVVEYDRNKNLQPENAGYIEWKKPPIPPNTPNPPVQADFDFLEFERKSDENINCTLNFHRDDNPERFAVSKDLAEIIDVEEATRERVVTGIWDYARAMHLQQDEEKRYIQCDARLRAVRIFPHLYLNPSTDMPPTGLRSRSHLLSRTHQLDPPAPLPALPPKAPLHHPRRPRVPRRAYADCLRHPRPRRRHPARAHAGHHAQPGVSSHADADCGAGQAARADSAGD